MVYVINRGLKDGMDFIQLTGLLEAQQQIIRQIALEPDLPLCLQNICLHIEAILKESDARASVLMLDGSVLRHGAAPTLPKSYCRQIDGYRIGPKAGSCGTAAYTKKQVIVSDIANDSLWDDFRQLALQHGLRACWSTPIISSRDEVLGTFAIYYPYKAQPATYHLELIARFSNLAGLAIEREQAHQREAKLLSELELSNSKLEALVEVIPDLVIVLDEDGNYVDFYGARSDLIYRGDFNFIGRNVKNVLPEKLAQEVMLVIKRALSSGVVQKMEYSLEAQNGVRIFDGRVATIYNYMPGKKCRHHVLWMARDITEQKRAEEHIERLAFYDLLTGLPNRRLLYDRLELAIEKSRRDLGKVAILYIDLNDFKRINDSLGHSVGDALLVLVAERLSPIKRASDTFARIGGDEFVLIVDSSLQSDAGIIDDSVTVSKRLLKALSKPFTLENGSYKIGASIGISIIDDNTVSADEMLKRADSAMYAAKKLGGNSFSFYDPSIQVEIDRKLQIEREIISSLEQGQFCAFFQPQVDTHGKVVGAEALIRWVHPVRGLISPFSFIPIAEQSGLIFQLQNIVMEDACLLLSALRSRNLVGADFTVSINISSNQFKTGKLDENLLKIMRKHNVPAESIVLEITESLLMQNRDEAVTQMQRLKMEGFRFSVDDFGTGYSSLAYLHALPLDELKIDKSFVDQIQVHERGTAIIDSIISMAGHLRLHVIAEGVETQEQFEALSRRPISAVQGYLFSKPLPAAQFIEWVLTSEPARCARVTPRAQFPA